MTRRLKPFICLYAAIILIVIWKPPACASDFTLHYEVHVVDPSRHLVHIKAQFNNFPERSACLKLHSYYDGDRLIELENVKARTSDGSAVETVRDDRCYQVSNGSARDFTVEYDLSMNQKNLGYMGYLCESYLLSNSGWTFLIPEGITASEYRVLFRLPSRWMAVTPWKQTGGLYVEKDFRLFIEATYGCGEFVIAERNISGTTVKIAMDSHFDAGFRDSVSKGCFQIFGYVKSLFGAAGPGSHLSILAKAREPMPAEWQYLNENGLSQGEAVDSRYWTYYQYSHRIFHTFNCFYPLGMNIEPLWFLEGTNEYYGALSFMDLHFEPPLGRIAYKYNSIYKKDKARYDGPTDGSERLPGEFEHEQYLYYHKGALVSFMLDREIEKATKGRKSMKDLLRTLYEEHGQFRNGSVTNTTIIRKLSEITGKDFSAFFRDYLIGTRSLDLDDLLKDSDGDGICDAAEAMLKTDPDSRDTDGDAAVDGLEYRYGTDPLDAASKPDLPLYIDGFSYDWSRMPYQKLTGLQGNNLSVISEVNYTRINDYDYILLRTGHPAIKDSTLRYYANIDIDSDRIGEVQVAAVYGSYGDTSRFRKDWSNRDMKPLDDLKGPQSAVSTDIEFRIPVSLVNNVKDLNISFGIWDTKSGKALESTDWLKLSF